MTKIRWILLSVSMFIPLLVRELLINCKMQFPPKAEAYLFLGIAGFLVNKIVPKEYHCNIPKWFAILFLLLFVSTWF